MEKNILETKEFNELTQEDVEIINASMEEVKPNNISKEFVSEKYIDIETGNVVNDDIVPEEKEEKEESLQDTLNTITAFKEQSRELNKEKSESLRKMNISKMEQHNIETKLCSVSEEDLRKMDLNSLKNILGRKLYENMGKMMKHDTSKLDEMFRDYAITLKHSLTFEKQLIDVEEEIAKHQISAQLEFTDINHETLLVNALKTFKEKLETEELTEENRINIKFTISQIVDSIELNILAKSFISSFKNTKSIDRFVNNEKDFKRFNDHFIKTLKNNTQAVFIDPRGDTKYEIPDMLCMLKDILPEEYKEYHRHVYYILFKKFTSNTFLQHNVIYMTYLLRNIRCIHSGNLEFYKDKFINGLIILINIYKNS